MTRIAGLEARLRRIINQVEPLPKTWCFALSPDEEIPMEAASRIQPNDMVHIQMLPANYLDGLEEEEGSI